MERVAQMTREEITTLAEPIGFKPFTIITSSGARFNIPDPDYIDIPPGRGAGPSYVTVYNRASVARFITLANIDAIEFKPIKNNK
jgi:hypothetical protein